jgi:hypothetical protein
MKCSLAVGHDLTHIPRSDLGDDSDGDSNGEGSSGNRGLDYSEGGDGGEGNDGGEDDEGPQETKEDITAILTALEQWVFTNNTKVNQTYSKRGGISKDIFKKGDIVTLAVEKKRRVVGEPL